ncbi:LrgB family protein [Polycladomyces zharkentensis]|uniref:LrgB family protein n=1 Tax=Polycladomyces zharkentensis TaxID=2807616 RepID=UPI002FFAF096
MTGWTTAAGLLGTVTLYAVCKWVHRRLPIIWLSPVVVTPIILIAWLKGWRIPYSQYHQGAKWLTDLLQPATVAFAVPMYRYLPILKKHGRVIITSVGAGSFVAIISTLCLSAAVGTDRLITLSLIPRSVTTPIAMEAAKIVGGIPALTAAFVIVTGVFGYVSAPFLIRLLHIRTPIAQGVMIGTAAHGIGTSKAFELDEQVGTVSSLSLIVAGLVTVAMVQMGKGWF